MPALGTLVVRITADDSGFVTSVEKVADEVKQFEKKATIAKDATSSWGKELEHLGSRFSSLHGLLAIGLGVHLGRALFTEIHAGMERFISGMSDARGHGESWADALGSGLMHMVGMKTMLDQIVEQEKRAAELAKEASEARIRGIGQGRSQFDLYRDIAHVLGTEIPGMEVPANLTDPKLKAMYETLQGRMGSDTDKIQTEQARLIAIAAERKALEKSYTGPTDKYYEQLNKLKAEERDAQQKIKEATEDQLFAQNLLTGFTKAAAIRQRQIDSDAIDINKQQKALLEKMDKFDIAAPAAEHLPNRASIGGLADLHNQLQMAALGGDDELPKINAEQKKQTQQLQGLNDKLKNNQPLIWAGVA